MATLIDDLGLWEANDEYVARNKRGTLPKAGGGYLVVVPDANSSEAFARANSAAPSPGNGSDNDTIRVYEADEDFNVQQIHTVTDSFARPFEVVSSDLYSDNSVGIVNKRSGGWLWFRKLNTAAGTWGNPETVFSPAAGEVVDRVDITITDNDVPVIIANVRRDSNPRLVTKIFTRRTSDGTWVESFSDNTREPGTVNEPMHDCTITAIKAGGLAWGVVSGLLNGTDSGMEVWTATIDTATGTIFTPTKRATYLAGEMQTNYYNMSRGCWLFRSGTGEIVAAYMQARDDRRMIVAKIKTDGNTWDEVAQGTYRSGFGNLNLPSGFTATYARGRVNFVYSTPWTGGNMTQINYIAWLKPDNSVDFSGHYKWDNLGRADQGVPMLYPIGGTGRNADVAPHHAIQLYSRYAGGVLTLHLHRDYAANKPTNVSPGDGSAIATSLPLVTARVNLGKDWPQAQHRLRIQFATDSNLSTSLIEVNRERYSIVEGTDGAKYVTLNIQTDISERLAQGQWFMRVAVVDLFGNVSSWSDTVTFAVTHPPRTLNLSPSNYQQIQDAGNGEVRFTWGVTDPSSTDKQTAYQLIVNRADTGAVVYDSGKVQSEAKFHKASFDPSLRDVLLEWYVRAWDTDDIDGPYTGPETFTLAAPPQVVIDAPTPGAAVTSAVPYVAFTPTVGGERVITSYSVTITQGSQIIYASGPVKVSVPSGEQIVHNGTNPVLENEESYTVQVVVKDNTGLTARSNYVSFPTQWIVPAAPGPVTASSQFYNVEDNGYVEVYWDDDTRDANFQEWRLYRRTSMLDDQGQVIRQGKWEHLTSVRDVVDLYQYNDYYAPSGYKVDYQVTQLVNVYGEELETAPSPMFTVYPQSDGYWLMSDSTGTAYRLTSVTDDQYTTDYEESELLIIGRGRVYERGTRYGVSGSLTAKLRRNARERKVKLEEIRDTESMMFLRNPFGDVYPIYVGAIGVSRIAGVGKAEHVDVTIPYSEVAR